MKILLSAFAFAPNVGSEAGVGWHWAEELAKLHEVIVVTDWTRRSAIEANGVCLPERVKVVYFRPGWLRSVPLNSVTAQILYTFWQFSLLGFARKLHNNHQFDLAIHITYGVFRHPSFLGYLGIPFVFGPLGGGEVAPFALKRSIGGRENIKELIRSVLNTIALFDPFLWAAYFKTTLILTKTEDTRRALPWPFRFRAVVYPEIGIKKPAVIQPKMRGQQEPLRVLFAGRLLGWKGAHLAIRAVAIAIRQGVKIDFTLLGTGPYEYELRKVAAAERIHERISWLSHIPQQELFELYRNMHCFLFPSLHDSSGNVVLESLSFGLPVICLDLGGPPALVDKSCAIIVNTKGNSEQKVVEGLAAALMDLGENESRRRALSGGAIARAAEMTWECRISGAMDLISSHIGVKSRNY